LRQRPSRYAIRAGRNFTLFPCFQGRRLSLHLCSQAEGRRLTASLNLSCRTFDTVLAFAAVVTGSKSFMLSTSHGIALLLRVRVSPLLAGVAREIALSRGSSSTRQGISLGLLPVARCRHRAMGRSFLPASPRHHRVRTISSSRMMPRWLAYGL
jgi:hypothetical protein